MEIFHTVFYTLIVLGVLVSFHEFGHFWVARRCGVKVLTFSIGFGPVLCRWRDRQGTEFALSALPLGGYVKMLDEREAPVAETDQHRAFNRKSVWQRMAVVSAGPAANFGLAILLYWVVYLLGVQGVAPVVGAVAPGSVAAVAGLKAGQEIIAVDGEPTPTWQALNEQLVQRIGDSGEIRFAVKASATGSARIYTGVLDHWDVNPDAPDPIAAIGIELYQPRVAPVIDKILPGEPAAQAGLRAGDRIHSADGIAMADWATWVDYVRARPGQVIELILERDGDEIRAQLTPRPLVDDAGNTIGQVGVSVVVPEWPAEWVRDIHYGPIAALGRAFDQTWKTSTLILGSVKKMLFGDISIKHLSGPITIAKVAGASADHGVSSFLQFMALLSVSLGVLNLLPIPVLDGGHLIYYLVEASRGRPVSEKIQMLGYRVGLLLVVGLMAMALYNDLLRL